MTSGVSRNGSKERVTIRTAPRSAGVAATACRTVSNTRKARGQPSGSVHVV